MKMKAGNSIRFIFFSSGDEDCDTHFSPKRNYQKSNTSNDKRKCRKQLENSKTKKGIRLGSKLMY